ncbi:ABC transporter substrate-binding protein [Bacillus sp. FJAT-28004]|jgi:iron complex transport system substrate-binding protein|uniref:ABC transporter substrate-binding protein n=1 Tax=Bacillus sp. FJAT-28004 TaxID=1679165 RepID=UPI0006B4F408|nr:ABC transporter substrate-binding protein [Bacillus sp. FJAT-28004]
MYRGTKSAALLATFALMGSILLACGSNSANSGNTASPTAEATKAPAATEQAAETTRSFTDWSKHVVEVPVTPQRVIFHGETTGDLLALGVKPVGVMQDIIKGTVFEQQLTDVEDVGFPLSVEKSLTLQPDLIIFSNSDEQQYEVISKVAPTVTFNSFATLEERMRTLGDLLNKKQEAEDWLAEHAVKTAEMWKQIHDSGIKEGETASVFTMYPGNRLFIMAGTGLPQFLYEKGGFKPTPIIQDIIDKEQGFVEISSELLPEYAADRIFILNPVAPDAQQSTNELMKSDIWLKLPAVKNGQVYNLDLLKASSDALSREWLIEELPKALIKK